MPDLVNVKTNPDYIPLNENDVVNLVFESTASFSEFNEEVKRTNEVCSGYKNAIRLAFASSEELKVLGLEAQASQSLFGRVTAAFSSILPFLESLGARAGLLFDKRRSVLEDRKSLENYMDRVSSLSKSPDPSLLKPLDLYFYDYKSLMNVLSTLNHSISENDKYLKNILSSRTLSSAFQFGYTEHADNYAPVEIDSTQIKCHPTQLKFFEHNTLDDLMFATDQLSRSCGSLEMMLMHDTQFKSALSNLKTKPGRVKNLVGDTKAILKLGDEVNDMTRHCGRIVNNVALLLKVNKTLTTVTKDVWENVLGLLEK